MACRGHRTISVTRANRVAKSAGTGARSATPARNTGELQPRVRHPSLPVEADGHPSRQPHDGHRIAAELVGVEDDEVAAVQFRGRSAAPSTHPSFSAASADFGTNTGSQGS